MIRRVPFLCIDSTWRVRWKDLWTTFAGPAGTYTGYIDAWDGIPFQRIMFDDGHERDYNFAAQAQYMPSYGGSGDYLGIYEKCIESGLPETYCHNCVGLVQDLIALLEADGIAESEIVAQCSWGDDVGAGLAPALDETHSHEERATARVAPIRVRLRDLFFREFEPANVGCPSVFSRPLTHHYEGAGHICDNAQKLYYCTADNSCDGTTGLNGSELNENFRADALWFSKSFLSSLLLGAAEGHHDARLVLYIIAAGSVPRIKINGTWEHVSPLEYFPSYGDPYGFVFRGHRAVIESPNFLWGEEAENSIIVEHIAPRGEDVGAQVIFALEWDESIIIDETEVSKMARSPRPSQATSAVIRRWEILLAQLANYLQQFPYLQDEFDDLTQFLQDLRDKDTQQEHMKGALKVLSGEVNDVKKDGGKIYKAILRHLEGEFGKDAPQIAKFVPQAQDEVDKTKKGWGKDKPEQPVEPK